MPLSTAPDLKTPSSRGQVTGLVLAGGLGRRMGGVDKGLQLMGGRPLVAQVIERLAPQVATLIINANRNEEAYRAFGYPVVRDAVGGFAGPLAGLQAGLAICETPFLVCAPCDSPFLPTDLVVRLLDGIERADALVAMPNTLEGPQPVFALVRRQVLPMLDTFLATGGRGIQAWCRQLPLALVDFPDDGAFANINTREELAAAEEH